MTSGRVPVFNKAVDPLILIEWVAAHAELLVFLSSECLSTTLLMCYR
jgi:hypothetical protein